MKGVPNIPFTNKAKAAEFFKRAPLHWRSWFNLCLMYKEGDGVEYDLVKANEYCEIAYKLAKGINLIFQN